MARPTKDTNTTVTTNLPDYAPGDWAEITASGFTAGSTVMFKVDHVSGTGPDGVYGTVDDRMKYLGGDGHTWWKVTDGGDGDLDGLANGVIVTKWYVNPDDSLNETFRLTAKGMYGEAARTSFTDASGSTNKVYQHWADGDARLASLPEWNNNILSDNKSDYFEGQVIPHVFVYKASNNAPLVNGEEYSFNITYNYYQSNTKAGGFLYITTYNLDRAPGKNDATKPYVPPTEDSTYTSNDTLQKFVKGSFYTVDANVTGVQVANLNPSLSATTDQKVTVTFRYTGTDTTNGIAEFYYGLYVAMPGDVGTGTKGASAWTGGSLQTTVDIGGSGATSIQLAPSAIIQGSISGYKFNDANANGTWDTGEARLSNWTIYLDANNNGNLDTGERSTTTDGQGFYQFFVTPDANKATTANDPYIVREVNQTGWTQTAPTSGFYSATISAITPTASNLNFGNFQPNASLTIEKQISVDGGTTWLDADTAGLVVAAGTLLQYRVAVSNGGNVDATVNLSDTVTAGNGTALDFVFGSTNSQTTVVTAGQTVYSNVISGVSALADTNTDVASATATYGPDNTPITVTDDPATYFGTIPTGGLIAPTNTTVQQYIKGPDFYDTFQEYYAFQGGVVQYGIKSGNINQTNPGVFFYFTGASGQLKSDSSGAIKIVVDQNVTTTDTLTAPKTAINYSFLTTLQNITLYRVNDLNGNGVVDGTDTLSSVQLRSGNVVFGKDGDYGDITVSFNGGTAGTMYVLSVKYNTGSVVGQPGSTLPTFNYTYATKLGASTTTLESGGLSMKAKPAMMLDGEAGDGARAVNESQVNHVLKQAMAYWEGQGISDEQKAMLKSASVEIANIGGSVLAQSDVSQHMITIDDDGAGHGWSLGIGAVAKSKVDLFSVLVHEMGHLLGESDDDMGNLLAVGDRTLPQSATPSESLPLPASILGVVGTETQHAETHFG